MLLLPKLRQLFCHEQDLNRLGFEETVVTENFHFRNKETEDMLVYQSNPVGVEIFSHKNTSLGKCYIFCAQKSRPAKRKVHISKAALVLIEEKRVHNTQRSYSFRFVRKVAHIS